MIDPAGIPVIDGDVDTLTGHAATPTRVGTEFGDTGPQIHAGWQCLGAVHHAPVSGGLVDNPPFVEAPAVGRR